MTLKLLTEHHLEFLSLKGGCRGSSESTRQNATLLEITCHGSYDFLATSLYRISYYLCFPSLEKLLEPIAVTADI